MTCNVAQCGKVGALWWAPPHVRWPLTVTVNWAMSEEDWHAYSAESGRCDLRWK